MSSYMNLLSDDSDEDPDFYLNKRHKEYLEREKKRIKSEKAFFFKYNKSSSSRNHSSSSESIKNLPKIKPLVHRLSDENGAFVKNFCVGLSCLDDEFVKNALLGKIIWKQAFDQDEKLTKKHRNRIKMHSKFEPGYLFETSNERKLTTKKIKSKDLLIFNDVNNNEMSDFNNDFSDLDLDHLNKGLNGNQQSSSSNQFTANESLDNNKDKKELNKSNEVQESNDLPFKSNQFLNSSANLKQDLNIATLNKILSALNQLKFGQLEEIEINEPIKCLNCSYTTTSINNLFIHSAYHRNVCDICKTSFKSVLKYFHHLGYHLKEAKELCSTNLEFRCNKCQIFFKNESLFINHCNSSYTIFDESEFFGERILKFKCEICNLVDVTFKTFQDHYSKYHLEVKCSFCNQWFKSIEQIEQHAFIDHKPFVHNYECKFCFLKFTFKTVYEDHLMNKHCVIVEDNQKKTCYLCDQELVDDVDLIIEHLADHCDLFIYKCDTCGFCTNSKHDMISHTMNIGLNNKFVLLATRMDLNLLWNELVKKIQTVQQDIVLKDQLDEAISSIL